VVSEQLDSSGGGLAAIELAIRAAMTRLGADLLGRLLGADTGHRGPLTAQALTHTSPSHPLRQTSQTMRL